MSEPSELSDLLKGAVDEVPPFDVAALVGRQRQRRQLQLAGAASAVVAIGLTLFVWNDASNNGFIVKTRSSSESTTTSTVLDSTTSEVPTTDGASTTTGSPPPPPEQTTTTSTQPTSTDPGADDFLGSLSVYSTAVHVGDTAEVDWSIVNSSDHLIEPFQFRVYARDQVPIPANTHILGAICVKLTPDGQPTGRLSMETDRNLFFPPSITRLEPGDGFTWSSFYKPTADDIGTVTCEVVILTGTFTDLEITARVTAIPPVTITVLPADTTTTVTTR